MIVFPLSMFVFLPWGEGQTILPLFVTLMSIGVDKSVSRLPGGIPRAPQQEKPGDRKGLKIVMEAQHHIHE